MVPLDPAEGVCYTEPMCDEENEEELYCIYQIIALDQDQVNPTVNGRISWERDSSRTSNSDEEIERWQNRLHKVTTLNCNRMVRSLCCVTIEGRELLTGTTHMEELVERCEMPILE